MPYEKEFAALSHPLRQRLIDALTETPRSVRELTDMMATSQPVVSQHLKVLRDAGFVQSRAIGKRNVYTVDPDKLHELKAFWEAHWASLLNSLNDEQE